MATSYRDVSYEGNRYRQRDVVRSPQETGAWGIVGMRKPVRETSFQAIGPGAPKIHGTYSHSPHQLKAPVMVRSLGRQEREDQKKRNLALGLASGAGAGKVALSMRQSYKVKDDPKKPLGIFAQLRRHSRETPEKPINVSFREAGRSYARNARGNITYVGGGLALGGALAYAKNRRMKNRPEYATAYSTSGMKPLRKIPERRS